MDINYFRTIVGEAIGEASMCWDTPPTGVFDSTRASALVDVIVAHQRSSTEEESLRSQLVEARARIAELEAACATIAPSTGCTTTTVTSAGPAPSASTATCSSPIRAWPPAPPARRFTSTSCSAPRSSPWTTRRDPPAARAGLGDPHLPVPHLHDRPLTPPNQASQSFSCKQGRSQDLPKHQWYRGGLVLPRPLTSRAVRQFPS